MFSDWLKLDVKSIKLPQWASAGAASSPALFGLTAKYPPVAMDIGASQLTVVRLNRDKKQKTWSLDSHDLVDLPSDLLESEVFRVQVKSQERFSALLTGALAKEGVKTTAVSLVLPDHLARVALIPFEDLPKSRRELIEMVRWKMKKAVPFKVEDSVVDYQILPPNGSKTTTVLAVLMPSGIVDEHDTVFRSQGIHAGLIDLSSFSLMNLYRTIIDQEVPSDQDFMLLNVTSMFFAVMVFRSGRLVLYRCKTFAFEGVRDAEGDYRMLRRELQASLVYYQEKLGGAELARIYMRVVGHEPARIADIFKGEAVSSEPEPIDPSRLVAMPGVSSGASSELLQRLAPAVGAALGREWEA